MKYRDILEIAFGGLGCVISPMIIFIGAIAYIFVGTMIWAFFGLAIKYWYLTIVGLVLLLVGYYYFVKITERSNERKQEKARELERQKTCELCKNHIELDKPCRHKIVGFDDFSKTELKWNKYGKAIIIQNNEKGFCVEISNILQKSSTSSGFQSINSYTIPIFDVDCQYDINSLVDSRGSEIVCVFTEDRKRHIYIKPKLFSNEESGALLKYEQIYPNDAKKDFPFKVEILNAKEILDQSDETKLERINGKWGLKCIKHEGNVTKFIPLLNNLQIESLPTSKWKLANKQAKLYLYHFAAYEKNEKYIPNNIFADRTQPVFIWKETTKIYIDSEIIFDVKLDLAFTVIELVSLCDDKRTTITIVDERYSKRGAVVKTIELPSFEGDFAPLYLDYLSWALDLAKKCEEAIKTGRFFGQQEEQTKQIGEQNATIHDGLSLVKERTNENDIETIIPRIISKKAILFFDTETTGIPLNYKAPSSDTQNWPRLVQLAWILTDDEGNRIHTGNLIVKPDGFVIPADATKVHGITTQRAKEEGVPLAEAIEQFKANLDVATYIVGHNIEFDKKIVGAEMIRLGMKDELEKKKSCCTMLSSIDFCKIPGKYGFKYPKLQELYRKLFGEDFEDAHNAMCDIEATEKCFWELRKRKLI